MLDPRVEDNAKEIQKTKEALLQLATIIDGVAWRTSARALSVSSPFL